MGAGVARQGSGHCGDGTMRPSLGITEPATRLTLQVILSGLLVITVLWFMWKLPRKNNGHFDWAPPLALLSAWGGALSAIASGLLWVVQFPDSWLVLVLLVLDPGAIGAGALVLWIYRGNEATHESIHLHRLQARVGIVLGLLAVTLGYVFVMTNKMILTPVGAT